MKKLIVTLTVMGIMVGSIATLSSAYHIVNDCWFGNRYNGSYYYDIGWSNVTVKGEKTKTYVDVRIAKNGNWTTWKRTTVSGSKAGNTLTCYSNTIQGKGANKVEAKYTDVDG